MRLQARAHHGDHPRSRGENDRVLLPLPLEAGSSPLTRGKLQMRADLGAVGGIIPAHAGKTPTSPAGTRA